MLTTIRVSPRPVAVARILLAAGALLTCYEGAQLLAGLDADRITTPVSAALPSASAIAPTPWFLTMAAASVLLALGVLARTSAGVLLAGNVLLLLVDHQLYSNHRFLLVLLCLWFALARTDRAWALGARSRRETDDGLVPWWPQLLVVATVSACYLFAGLSKINPEFLSGELIAELSPDWVPARLAAWATVPTEIVLAAALWWRRARLVAVLLGAALHVSIVVLLGTPLVFAAFALLCAAAYPLAWTLPRLAQAEAAATQRASVA